MPKEATQQLVLGSLLGVCLGPLNSKAHPCWLHTVRESRPEVVQGPGAVGASLTLLVPGLVWSQQKIAAYREVFRVLLELLTRGKHGVKINE